MMLGETLVVGGGGGGGGGGTLLRPRSADNLSRLAPASSLPALDDLTESEVFVGEEEEENQGLSNGYKQDEPLARPDSLQQIKSFDQVMTCDGAATPDLHSPTSPSPTPTTNLVITYHDEGLRLPLDAVKEEAEAEALEEASMILSSGPGSLSHTSLTSSVMSNTSLDDATLSSRTDTFDTVIAVPIVRQVSSPESTNSSPTPAKTSPPSRPGNRDAARVSGTTPTRTSPTSPRSSGRSSPRSTDAPRTPERRRKAVSVSSPRSDSSRGSTPRASAMRVTPRTSEKVKSEEKKAPRSSLRSSTISADRKSSSRLHDPVRKDAEKPSSHSRTKTTDRDHDDSRTNIAVRKKKVDTKDNTKTEADRSGTLGRKKKEPKSEKEEVFEKFGTFGRRRAKESGDAKDYGKEMGMSKDTKNTLDMYATLPRRKAREMSARWREQMASEDEASKSSLRRTKSIGKTESSGTSSSARGRGTSSVMTSSLPPSALSSIARSRSPRSTNRDARPSSAPNARKERTIICMETAVQTSITGSDVSSAMRALSRQNSSATNDDETQESKPHVIIVSEVPVPKDDTDRKSVEVQVELAWRLGDGELPEHVRRLTEEHTRLQTEHSRARARLEETEKLQGEMESLRSSLREERAEKEEVQAELDRTSQRVKEMLASMEGVEHEFNSRGDSLIELETQLHHSTNVHIQMQEKLNQYEEFTLKIKRDLDKSVAAQKTLLQQVQDLENEGREISDFMAEEKNALAECLREAETELARLREECKQLSAKYKQKDEEARHMVRLAEERKNKCMALQAEISMIQSRTRDMMVCQGAEVSGAAVSLANLSSRLQTLIGKLVQDYSITESDLEMIVTPTESDSSASSTNGTPERKSPYKVSARTPSPRKTASFISALLHAMRGSPKEKTSQLGGMAHINGTTTISKQTTEGRNSPEGSESNDLELEVGSSGLGSPPSNGSLSLADQVNEVDLLLTRFLKVCCVLKNDTDNRLSEIEDENERLCNQIRSQQVIIDQQHSDYETLSRSESRAKRELMATTRDLDATSQKLNKFYQADYELQVQKLEDEVERLGTTVRHLEALHTEKEQQLATSLASLSEAQGPAPPNHVPLATHQQETATLNDKVTSLRQSVIERDRRISELSERHSDDLASIREAQVEAQKSNRRLASTVDHVLKTLESVPDIVSGSSTLKQLFSSLAASEKSNMQQQQNGNSVNKNVNNKDLNANPQTIMNVAINSKKLSPTMQTETHL